MKLERLFIVPCCATLALLASAQTKSSLVGTWKLDAAQTQLGPDRLKSLTVVIRSDTPETLSWEGHGVNESGEPLSLAWSGPEDGSMHPTVVNGKARFNQSARKERDGTIVRYGADDDGSLESRSKISADGQTLVDEIVYKAKDGKESRERDVYHRVSAHGTKSEPRG